MNARFGEWLANHNRPLLTRGRGGDGSTQTGLLQRLKAIEDYIAQVQSAHDTDSSAASPDSRSSGAAKTRVSSISEFLPETGGRVKGAVSYSRNRPIGPGSAQYVSQLDAPLLKMLKDSLVIEPQSSPDASEHAEPGIQNRIYLRDESILPDTDLLVSMLEATEQYWFLWPVQLSQTGQNPVGNACRLIESILSSGRAVLVAKALLWLTLCVQQLVGQHRQLLKPFKHTQRSLSEIYLAYAIKNLGDDLDQSDYRDGLDCYMLQMKVYINLGRPHKAWQTVRRAIDLALLLGVDRPGTADVQGRGLFQYALQFDRNLGSLLGLPPSFPEDDGSLVADNLPESYWQARVFRDLSIVGGRITARDRALQIENGPVTAEIENRIDLIKAQIPQHARSEALPDGLPFAQYNMQFQMEVYLFGFLKSLHLPFAFKKSPEPLDRRSREIAMHAARNICKSYQIMRNKTPGQIMMCDLADFQVFTGAATLVIGLLYPITGSGTLMDELADWQLIDSVSSLMRQSRELIDCTVAVQAAELLENLSLARHGLLPPGEDFCAAIPYFGKFRIRQRRKVELLGLSDANNPELVEAQPEELYWNSIEFDAQDSFNPGDPIYDLDYGADWLTGLELDNNFDWSAVFEQPMIVGQAI